MKKISLILFLFSIITFSCSNLNDVNPFSQNNAGGENSTQNDSDPESPCYYDPQLNKYVLQISFSLNDKSGAVPASKTVESRSALASGGSDTSSITNIKVYSSQDGNDFSLLSQATQASEKISLTLSAGTYWLRAEAYAGKNLVYKTSSDLKIELTGAELSEPLVLHLICINSGSQSSESGLSADKVFELPMKIASGFSAYEVICDDSSYNNDVKNCFNVSKTSINSVFSGAYTKTVSGGIPSGTYIVKFNFYQKDSSTGIEYIAYSIPYVDITVSKGLTTDTWVGNENDYLTPKTDGTLEMNITSALAFNLNTVYVDSSLSKSGSGSSVNKFNSLDEAAAAANKMTKCNTIVLTGNTTYPISKTISINKAMTIKSSTSLAATISRKNGFTDASMLKVGSSSGLLLDGITLNIQSKTGTGIVTETSEDGAGIYNSGNVTLSNTTIENGKCASGKHGSGIYNNGILTLYAGVTFTDCDVYLTSGKNITVASPSITGVVITPANYSTTDPLLKGIIDDVPTVLNSSYLTYIAPFSVTKNGSDNYYLDTSAKLIKEVIPISILAEKITGVPSSTDYPKLQAGSASDITKIATWSGSTNFSGQTIQLKENINMLGQTGFTGIGSSTRPFKGTFDGNSKTVSNLTRPLFNYTGDGSTVKSVTVSGTGSKSGLIDVMQGGTVSGCTNEVDINYSTSTPSTGWVSGGIAGKVQGGKIENCTNTGDVIASSGESNKTGGIVGLIDATENSVTISKCENKNSVITNDSPSTASSNTGSGGIVGYVSGTKAVTISECTNQSPLTSYCSAGGIVGYSNSEYLTISNCSNTEAGSITQKAENANSYYFGGIIGLAYKNNVINSCDNKANINISGRYIGGVCGNCYYALIMNCYNKGNISTSIGRDVGGISGTIKVIGESGIYNCYNTGDISGDAESGYDCEVGGISGYVERSWADTAHTQKESEVNITNCLNTGTITSNTGNNGGIIGSINGPGAFEPGTLGYNYFNSDASEYADGCGNKLRSDNDENENETKKYFHPFNSNTLKNSNDPVLTSLTISSTTVTDLLNKWVTNNSTSAKKYKQWIYSGGTYSFKTE